MPNGWTGYVSGWRQWVPNNDADLVCANNAAHCLNYGTRAGSFYVNG